MAFDKEFEHREALLQAALEEFSAQGYDQASINTILAQAGMSKGQFYYHFGSKEALYFALVEILIARKQEFLARTMQPEAFAQDIFAIFETQLRHGFAFARDFPAVNRFAESFARERGNAIYKKTLARYNFSDNAAIDLLVEQAHARGDFRSDLPLSFIKHAIGFLFTHAVEVAGLEDATGFEENMRYLIEFMRSGLGSDAQSRDSAPAAQQGVV